MIQTARLRLRRPRPADVDAYRSRSDVARFLSAGTWSREKTAEESARLATAPFDGPGDELVLSVELLSSREVIGEVGLVWLAHGVGAEVGYVFHPDFGGKGLATEAVSAALDEWGFDRILVKTDSANRPSRAVCERLGMTLVATSVSTDGRGVGESTYALSVRPALGSR